MRLIYTRLFYSSLLDQRMKKNSSIIVPCISGEAAFFCPAWWDVYLVSDALDLVILAVRNHRAGVDPLSHLLQAPADDAKARQLAVYRAFDRGCLKRMAAPDCVPDACCNQA
jgi:hypothetical protein